MGLGRSINGKVAPEATNLKEECSFSTGAVFDISGGRATY
jgi:hypothetical protein